MRLGSSRQRTLIDSSIAERSLFLDGAATEEASSKPPFANDSSWLGPPVRVRAGQQLVSSGTTGRRAADFGTPPNLKFSFLAVLLLASLGQVLTVAAGSFRASRLIGLVAGTDCQLIIRTRPIGRVPTGR